MVEDMNEIVFDGKDSFGTVQVVDKGKERHLLLGSSIEQSACLIEDPYHLLFEYTQDMAFSLLLKPNPNRVLFLGLGGGSLQKFYYQQEKESLFDIVELSPLVIDVAHRFFFLPKSSRIQIYNQDARDYIKNCSTLYDLVFVDLYNGKGLAEVILDPFFFTDLKQMTHSDSLIVFNLWKGIPNEQMVLLMKAIGATFGNHLLILPGKEVNLILFIFQKEIAFDMKALSAKAKKLEEETELPLKGMLERVKGL